MARRRDIAGASIALVFLMSGCTIRTAASSDLPVDIGRPTTSTQQDGSAQQGSRTAVTTTTSPPTTTRVPVPAAPTIPPLTGWDATDAYMEQRILGGGSQAASFAVSIDGEVVHAHAMGERVPGSGELATTTDRFRIASISKTIGAITMLRLVEQGYVGLDDPVGGLVAAALGVEAQPGAAADITVRQLLTHTSGFPQDENLFFGGQVGSCREAATIGFSRPLAGAPGVGYRYSNMNFCVLGLLIEGLTGKPYEQVVYEQLLTPLGLSGLRLAPTSDPGPDEIQHRTTPGRNYMEALGAAGGWVATPTDLVTIINSLDLSTPGWKPLSEATLAEMKTSVNDPLNPDRGYGMGLILFGGGAFGHTGTIENTHAMVIDRGDGVSWAVTVSGDYPKESLQLAQIMDAALFAGGFVQGAPIVVD
jgi:D-alanyl-D-alanine carboxypeptidase